MSARTGWLTRLGVLSATFISAAVLSATSAQAAAAHDDPWCARIVAFAAATQSGTVQRVRLETDWGGAFESNPRTLSAKHCDSGGSEAGQALCDVLLAEASVEFAQRNFERALRCLRPATGEANYSGAKHSESSRHVDDDRDKDQDNDQANDLIATYRDVEFSALTVPGALDHVLLSIGFVAGSERSPPTMTVTADATDADAHD